MIIYDVEHGSPQWENLRVGKATASEFKRIITPSEMAYSKQATVYQYELIAEMMLKRPVIKGTTQWMDRGRILESEAIKSYEMTNGRKVQKIGFISDDNKRVGCSPDFIDLDALGEVKCLSEANHVEYMVVNKIPKEHKPQTQGQLWIGEKERVVWYGYYPGMPPVEISEYRDEVFIKALSSHMDRFQTELNEMIENIIKRGLWEIDAYNPEEIDFMEAAG